KTYKAAIKDFEECIANWGDSYEMDHTYSFYIGLSYLQLNEFEKAEEYFKHTIAEQKKMFGETEAHHLDLFYYAITEYELEKYDEAISLVHEAIGQYAQVPDAIYYQAVCLFRQNRSSEEVGDLISQAGEVAKKGYTVSGDNASYGP